MIPDSWVTPDWRGRRKIVHPRRWDRLPEFEAAIVFVQEKREFGHQNWWFFVARYDNGDIVERLVMGQTVVTSSPGTTQTITSDATFNPQCNTVEGIGAGSVGSIGSGVSASGAGGGGGAYTRIVNMSCATPGSTQFFVRAGAAPAAAGTVGDSWLTQTSPGTSFPAAAQIGLGAKGGVPIASTTTATGSAGGAAASAYTSPATGAITNNGGTGGNAGAANNLGGAGGGAGGQDGAGVTPANSTASAQAGGAGNNNLNNGGAGGPAGNGSGANGVAGKNINFGTPVGSGGGGGGGNASPSTGGAGGLYGGGGGGGGRSTGTAGAGTQGVVVISWQIWGFEPVIISSGIRPKSAGGASPT